MKRRIEGFLFAHEAADELAISPRTLARLIQSGRGPASTIYAGRRLFRRADLRVWLENELLAGRDRKNQVATE